MEIVQFINKYYTSNHSDFSFLLELFEKYISHNIDNTSIYLDNHFYEENGLYTSINNTQTLFGNIMFQTLLLKPEHDINTLLKKQHLVENIHKFKDELAEFLNYVKTYSDDLLWLWKKKNNEETKSLQFIFFNKGFLLSLNHFLPALQINNILKYMFTRPYAEVVQLIALLTKLPKLDPKIKPEFVQEGDKKK